MNEVGEKKIVDTLTNTGWFSINKGDTPPVFAFFVIHYLNLIQLLICYLLENLSPSVEENASPLVT
jgi:hypothetical protein